MTFPDTSIAKQEDHRRSYGPYSELNAAAGLSREAPTGHMDGFINRVNNVTCELTEVIDRAGVIVDRIYGPVVTEGGEDPDKATEGTSGFDQMDLALNKLNERITLLRYIVSRLESL